MTQSPAKNRSSSPFGGSILHAPFPVQLGQMHTHTTCEIFCVFRGTGYFIVEGAQHKLEHGKIILLRPGEMHRLTLTGDDSYDRISYHFHESVVDAIDPQHTLLTPFFDRPLGEHNVYTCSAAGNSRIYDLLAQLVRKTPDEYTTRLNARVALFSLLSEFKHLYDARQYLSPDQDSAHLRAVLEYINNNLTQPLSVDGLCQRFFMSRSQLNREFKRATGTTVWDYVMSKRLLQARIHIANGMRAGEAAVACGFRDYSAFYRSYVKKYETPPSVAEQ